MGQYRQVGIPQLFMGPSYWCSTLGNIYSYKKGVSHLLRDSLSSSSSDPSSEAHICVTDHNASVRERVGDMLFEYTAGSFFQNNNSIFVPLTSYIHDAIFPPSSTSPHKLKPTHLVDAYCDSGLFAITLFSFRSYSRYRVIDIFHQISQCKPRSELAHSVQDHI